MSSQPAVVVQIDNRPPSARIARVHVGGVDISSALVADSVVLRAGEAYSLLDVTLLVTHVVEEDR